MESNSKIDLNLIKKEYNVDPFFLLKCLKSLGEYKSKNGSFPFCSILLIKDKKATFGIYKNCNDFIENLKKWGGNTDNIKKSVLTIDIKSNEDSIFIILDYEKDIMSFYSARGITKSIIEQIKE